MLPSRPLGNEDSRPTVELRADSLAPGRRTLSDGSGPHAGVCTLVRAHHTWVVEALPRNMSHRAYGACLVGVERYRARSAKRRLHQLQISRTRGISPGAYQEKPASLIPRGVLVPPCRSGTLEFHALALRGSRPSLPHAHAQTSLPYSREPRILHEHLHNERHACSSVTKLLERITCSSRLSSTSRGTHGMR